jgi:Domain of unknown function (DUF4398)
MKRMKTGDDTQSTSASDPNLPEPVRRGSRVLTDETLLRTAMIDRVYTSWYGPIALRRLLAPMVVLAVISGAGLLGCGPVEYMSQVGSKAASAVAAAKEVHADHYAPYEYTAADAYLHKAREEAGYAAYEDAIEYGHKAEELANRARAIALSRLSQGSETAPPQAPEGRPSRRETE